MPVIGREKIFICRKFPLAHVRGQRAYFPIVVGFWFCSREAVERSRKMGKESKRKRNKVRKSRKTQKRKQKQKESGKSDREGQEVPIEIESGSEISEGAQSGDIAASPPCLAPDMPRRDNAEREESIQTRSGLSKKEALLRRGPNGCFDSQGGALCASCKAIASTETSSLLSNRSFS